MPRPTAAPFLSRVLREFARYFAASGLALTVDVGLFRATLALGAPYALAAVAGFLVGAVTAYIASVRWVFTERSQASAAREFAVFVAIGVVGLLLTEAVLWVAVEKLRLSPMAGKLVAAGVVFLCNFTLRRAMLFTKGRATPVTAPLPAASGDALA